MTDGLFEKKQPVERAFASAEQLKQFNDKVWHEWQYAMSRFFEECDEQARKLGLSVEDVNRALWRGYGGDVADAWTEWVEED